MDPIIITRAERLPVQLCPQCGHKLDACTGLTGTRLPVAGDYTVCAQCVSLLQFGSDGALRQIEIRDVHPDRREMIRHIISAARAVQVNRAQAAVSRTGVLPN